MNKEQYEALQAKIAELIEELEALPDSTANGQLIDAAGHVGCAAEHLRRYFAMCGVKQ